MRVCICFFDNYSVYTITCQNRGNITAMSAVFRSGLDIEIIITFTTLKIIHKKIAKRIVITTCLCYNRVRLIAKIHQGRM